MTSRPVSTTRLVVLAAVAAVVVALVVTLALGDRGSGDGAATTTDPISLGTAPPAGPAAEQQPVALVAGNALPRLADPATDPAKGRPLPTVAGLRFDGTPVQIGPGGRRQLLVFAANWCPHCQREIPVLAAWINGGKAPAGLDIRAVATGTTSERSNYPPSKWLAKEQFGVPVLADSDDGAAASAFGVSAYPFFVLVNSDGTVAERFSGEIEIADLETKLAKLH